MGQILLLLNGGTKQDNKEVFRRICSTIKDKLGIALAENETILFQARPLDRDTDFSKDMEMTDQILSRRTRGLFRHLKMASSFENPELGETERFRISIDIFYMDHFINIKIFDMIFDLLQEDVPNTYEMLCIYKPFEKNEKYTGFTPSKNEEFYILQENTANLPEIVVHKGENY